MKNIPGDEGATVLIGGDAFPLVTWMEGRTGVKGTPNMSILGRGVAFFGVRKFSSRERVWRTHVAAKS